MEPQLELITGQDWSSQDLSGRVFEHCRFSACNFTGADLSRAAFEGCVFEDCNWTNPKVGKTKLVDALFRRCKILGVNFYLLDQFALSVGFEECQIRLCAFTNLKLKKLKLTNCLVAETDFKESDFSGSDLRGTEFRDALFHQMHLEKADFRDARGYSLDPRSNYLTGARFSTPDVLNLLHPFGILVDD